MQRCHEELLERLAKKTAVKELEVSVFASPALRHPYITLRFTFVFSSDPLEHSAGFGRSVVSSPEKHHPP